MSMGRFSPKNLAATLCVVGFCAILSGILFTVKDWDVSEIAVPCELADLEAGHPIPNRHLSIGEHTAIYEKPLVGSSDRRQKIEFVIYPIVSETELVSSESFKVLVRTRRFDTVSRIPKTATKKNSVVGMVALKGWTRNTRRY